MARRSRVRVDQLKVQEAVRKAARRCAVWGRDTAAGTANAKDEEFARALVALVQKFEKASPTSERGVRKGDKDSTERLLAVVEEFAGIIGAEVAASGQASPEPHLFELFSEALARFGYEKSPGDVERAIRGMLRKRLEGELVTDLSRTFKGPREAARECVGALELDSGSGARSLHTKARAGPSELPTERQVTWDELLRYFLACLSLGPYSSRILAGLAYSAACQMPPRLHAAVHLRQLMSGNPFGEPLRPRPAYKRVPLSP